MLKKTLLIAVPFFILIALVGIGFVWSQGQNSAESLGDMAQVSLNDTETAAGDPALMPETETVAEAAAPVVAEGPMSTPVSDAAPVIVVEGTDPKFPKAIGSLDAPVTMHDFSSLTCPHCAQAHEKTIPRLIKDYVETGKLRIVFADFPLNAQAMDASKVSRCMPADKYFGFVSLLFGSIEQWAENHPAALLQNAAMAGLTPEKAKACLEDKEVETALTQGVADASEKYKVSATPTFVFNDGKKKLQGAREYLEFQMAIDGLIEEQKDASKPAQ